MPHKIKVDPRIARERRDRAMIRGEIRVPTTPRTSSAGVTSFAVKRDDPETRAMIDDFLSRREERR